MDEMDLEKTVRKIIKEKFTGYFLYETHLHTSQGSACAENTGAEMAAAAKDYGYSGIIVTDHFYYGNTSVDKSLGWEAWVNKFCLGYEDAKKKGDEIGLDVFFGWESGYDGTEFLIYGLDKQWLLEHEELKDASVAEQYRLVKEYGGIVIQAHPFREASYIPEIRLFPEDVDGCEVLNISNGMKMFNKPYECIQDEKAYEYAKEHNFIMTAGSDVHSVRMLGSGMGFDKRLDSINDFINEISVNKNIVW